VNEHWWRDVVSGDRRGPLGAAVRAGLSLLEWPYSAAMAWRNARFDRTANAVERVGVPVISIGNVTVGGTGKTPLVAAVAEWFVQRGVRVGLVSRGYGSDPMAGVNDEYRELAQRLPNVPHVQDVDRVAAARRCIDEWGAQVIVLDDGFQHRRLARQLDLVVIDSLNPFGYGRLLPRGMLREPVRNVRRANLVVLSRTDLVDHARRTEIERELQSQAGSVTCVEAVQRPQGWLNAAGVHGPLEQLSGLPVLAFCGIGNPQAFRRTLEAVRVDVRDFVTFPDHHRYTAQDFERLTTHAQQLDAKTLVCTHKDLVKIEPGRGAGLPVWALMIEAVITRGADSWSAALGQILSQVQQQR
jgi:tetraacyldisaccharide 4'-kinase